MYLNQVTSMTVDANVVVVDDFVVDVVVAIVNINNVFDLGVLYFIHVAVSNTGSIGSCRQRDD